jgi:hypothetical protein
LLESKIQAYNAGDYFDADQPKLSRKGGVTIFEGMQNHTAELTSRWRIRSVMVHGGAERHKRA